MIPCSVTSLEIAAYKMHNYIISHPSQGSTFCFYVFVFFNLCALTEQLLTEIY